jgi:hypothetical protein
MRVLQHYRYFQPADGRFRYYDPATGQDCTGFSLVYSGAIPTDASEPPEELLERLLLRHASELRPQGRELRPVGAGDVFDLTGRGVWQVLPIGFRAVQSGRIELGAAN